jgi:hypothetical protein
MCIAILAVAAQRNWVRGVIKCEKVKATHAALISGLDTHSNAVVEFLVDHNVMASANWKGLVEMAG